MTLKLSSTQLILAGSLLRVGFFFFGIYQDNHSPVKYTDIDYLVFSDAAQYVYDGLSPYRRDTYRYTPLLAWMLVPNSWGGEFIHYGKFLFMLCDILTGVLISRTLERSSFAISNHKKLILQSIWILNPMVVTISTRGSSESVLTFIIMIFVDKYLSGNFTEAAFWLGLSIHFKIYPIIYLPALMYNMAAQGSFSTFKNIPILKWLNMTNVKFFIVTFMSLSAWTVVMYKIYGYEFLYHSYIYHMKRLDHRHNFSLYNIMLYFKSANSVPNFFTNDTVWKQLNQLTESIEQIAFLPQLILSAVVIPLILAQKNITACLFVQTFAFVTFNKVITSQYFIWFLIFLPHFLAQSKLLSQTHTRKSLTILSLWVISQACWLFFAYKLEFLGESTFTRGLLYSSIFFFLTNCWALAQFIEAF